MLEELQELRALLNLAGISWKEAARRLFMSYSTMNRKLRGEIGMTQEERKVLHAFIGERKGPKA